MSLAFTINWKFKEGEQHVFLKECVSSKETTIQSFLPTSNKNQPRDVSSLLFVVVVIVVLGL